MGLRCSLLGHDYGDSEIEREREVRGDEAVVTVREVRTCNRCDDRTVVTENKEVTAIATEEPSPPEEGPSTDDASGEQSAASAESSAPERSVVREAESSGPTESVAGNETGHSEHPGEAAAADDPGQSIPDDPDPDEDDGIILEESDQEPVDRDREYGEWPDPDEPQSGDDDEGPRPWPDAPDSEGDAGDEPESWPDVETAAGAGDAGAKPDAAGGIGGREAGGAQREADDQVPVGATAEAPADAPAGPAGNDGRARLGPLACPECGHAVEGVESSFREGDVCPQCHSGYLRGQ